MALFGGSRDIALFRHLNREIINSIIDTQIDFYKIALNDTATNIYGESAEKIYKIPVRIPCLIDVEDQDQDYSEKGTSTVQKIRFNILRDELRDRKLVAEVGDIINWNEIYWECDSVVENDYFMNRNPETNKSISPEYGWNNSICIIAHMTRRTKVRVESNEVGDSGFVV